MALDNEYKEHVRKRVEKYMKKDKIPGMTVGIVHDGEVAYQEGFGSANLTQRRDMTVETVFRIASISKLFAAVAVMQLVEEGKIGLHDRVNDHLTSYQLRPFQEEQCSITVHQLLTHTSGIGEIAPILGYLRPRVALSMLRVIKDLQPLSRFYGNRLGADCQAGAKWCYANHGYATLGQLVADVRGDGFGQVVQERILEPLGMHHSDFRRLRHILDRAGTAYRGGSRAYDFNIITLADGGLFCSIEDFGRFAQAIVTGNSSILKKETLDSMMTPHFQLDPRLPAMGLGFFVDNPNKWGGHRVVKHDGALLGWATSSFYAPDLGLSAYAFMNTNGHAPFHIAHGIMRDLIKGDQPTFPQPADAKPEVWQDLVGTYGPLSGLNSNTRIWLSHGAQFKVSIQNGKLVLKSRYGRWQKGITLEPADPNDPYAFYANAQPFIFKRDFNGRIDRIQFGYHEFFRKDLK